MVSAAWISGQLIECFSPAMPESTVRLGVSSNGVDFSYGSLDFVYTGMHSVVSFLACILTLFEQHNFKSVM